MKFRDKLKLYLDYMVKHKLKTSAVTSISKDVMKADLGATKTYIKPEHAKYLEEYNAGHYGIQATLPNNEKIYAEGSGKLRVNKLKLPALVFSGIEQ